MNAQILQNLKNKLEKSYNTFHNYDHHTLIRSLNNFWGLLQDKKTLNSILQKIDSESESASEKISSKIFNRSYSCANQRPEFENEKEQIEIAYIVIFSLMRDKTKIDFLQTIYGNDKYDENTCKFIEDFVEPLYNFVIESLDNNVVSLGVFQKYKQKCEWFLGEILQEKIQNHKEKINSRIEEQVLAPHLYEYLHNQGLEITSKEGQLGNGKYDFRGVDFIGEVKIFGDKDAIIQGFVEVLRHLDSANLSLGYLVIFNNAKKFLKTPESLQIHDKSIFVITVDIRGDKKTPSKDKVNSIEITVDEILTKWNSNNLNN